MSLDQMFALLRNWGEQHTAFGQTAEVQRAAVKRESSAEGRKADAESLPSRGVRVVLGTQIERGMAPLSEQVPSPPGKRPDQTDQGDAPARGHR